MSIAANEPLARVTVPAADPPWPGGTAPRSLAGTWTVQVAGGPVAPAARIPRPVGIGLMLLCIAAILWVERDRQRRIARMRAMPPQEDGARVGAELRTD